MSKSTTYTIRFATKADLPEVHSLVHELATFEKSADEHVLTLQQMQYDFDRAEPRFHVLLAENEKGSTVGMSFYYHAYSTWKGSFIFLEDLIVRSAYRKQGIGKLLLDATIQQAKELGMSRVKWEVLDWNAPAISFYNSLGAKHLQEWLVYRVTLE